MLAGPRREAILEAMTHPSEENTQRKESVTTPVQNVESEALPVDMASFAQIW